MDLNQILKLGAQAFMKSQGSGNTGSNLDIGTLISALTGLLGNKGGLDIGSLVGSLGAGGMGGMLQSWLGDGQNQAVSAGQIKNILGSDKIQAFASQLGLSEDEAVGGLQDAIPAMVDNASSGGSLLDSVGGMQGALGLASKLFGK